MIDRNANDKHRPRRIVLLSSAAGLALALLIAGPGGYLPHQCLRGVSRPKLRRPRRSP